MKWKLRTSFPQDNQVNQLMKAIDVQYEIAYLLVSRGVEDYDSAKRYFRPNKDDLHDPFIMLDMIKAVERVRKAIHNQEKIMELRKEQFHGYLQKQEHIITNAENIKTWLE